jgi:AraC-like DNA-binding protein
MYREFSFDLDGAVVWSRAAHPDHPRPGAPRLARILPDGCLDLIWIAGALVVAGPDTTAQLLPDRPGTTYVGVRFAPGQGPAVLGVPASEVRNARAPLDAFWPTAEVRRLADQVDSATDRPAALATAIADQVRRAAPDAAALEVARGLRRGYSVAAVADRVRLSPRQLHRRSLAAFGYGPKTLARVLRFDRAVALARAGTPLADVAATAGYADQAHLSREVRALAGVALGLLLRGG